MDPLSITCAVLNFVDTGVKIKAAVDKIGNNRRRLRELSEDILEDLYALRSFCDVHEPDLQYSPELKHSFDRLHRKLTDVASKCERALSPRTKGALGKIVEGYKSWRDADDVEAEIVRLREIVQSCMSRMQLYVSARCELAMSRQVAIAKTEHNTLVLKSDTRSNIHRLDAAFGESICGSNSAEFTSVLSHCASDGLDQKYLLLKLHDIAETLETCTFSFADPCSSEIHRVGYILTRPPFEIMTIIESKLVPVWRVIHSLDNRMMTPISRCLEPVLSLVIEAAQWDYNNTISRLFAIGESILRQAIDKSDDDNPLFFLSWVLYEQHWFGLPGAGQIQLSREMVDIYLRIYQSPRATFPKPHRLVWLQRAMATLAWDYYLNECTDMAISHYQEALQMADSLDQWDLIPHQYYPVACDTSVISSLQSLSSPTIVQDYRIAQSTAFILTSYARVLESSGRYFEAHYVGRDSITIIDALQAQADFLPWDFDLLDDQLYWLEDNLPSWVEIVRNPTVIEEMDEEDEGLEVDGSISPRRIEWGIAI